MNEMTKHIIKSLVEGHSTNCLGDGLYQAELLRVYKLSGDIESYNYLLSLIMACRKNWVNQLVLWQQKWQNCNKNNHHDSFEIREKYIAPHITGESEFVKNARQYNKTRMPKLFVWKYGIRN